MGYYPPKRPKAKCGACGFNLVLDLDNLCCVCGDNPNLRPPKRPSNYTIEYSLFGKNKIIYTDDSLADNTPPPG
jgi:hypothetical protein